MQFELYEQGSSPDMASLSYIVRHNDKAHPQRTPEKEIYGTMLDKNSNSPVNINSSNQPNCDLALTDLPPSYLDNLMEPAYNSRKRGAQARRKQKATLDDGNIVTVKTKQGVVIGVKRRNKNARLHNQPIKVYQPVPSHSDFLAQDIFIGNDSSYDPQKDSNDLAEAKSVSNKHLNNYNKTKKGTKSNKAGFKAYQSPQITPKTTSFQLLKNSNSKQSSSTCQKRRPINKSQVQITARKRRESLTFQKVSRLTKLFTDFYRQNQIGKCEKLTLGNRKGQARKNKCNTIDLTIVKENQMNSMDNEFMACSSQTEEKSIRCPLSGQFTLKLVAKELNLGYSTVLHKYTQFRKSRALSPGLRLLRSNHKIKTKYKKSHQIEGIISQCLTARDFTSVRELCEFINFNYRRKYSRSIVSRHLADLGYSYNNINAPQQLSYGRRLVLESMQRVYCSILTHPSVVAKNWIWVEPVNLVKLTEPQSGFSTQLSGNVLNQPPNKSINSERSSKNTLVSQQQEPIISHNLNNTHNKSYSVKLTPLGKLSPYSPIKELFQNHGHYQNSKLNSITVKQASNIRPVESHQNSLKLSTDQQSELFMLCMSSSGQVWLIPISIHNQNQLTNQDEHKQKQLGYNTRSRNRKSQKESSVGLTSNEPLSYQSSSFEGDNRNMLDKGAKGDQQIRDLNACFHSILQNCHNKGQQLCPKLPLQDLQQFMSEDNEYLIIAPYSHTVYCDQYSSIISAMSKYKVQLIYDICEEYTHPRSEQKPVEEQIEMVEDNQDLIRHQVKQTMTFHCRQLAFDFKSIQLQSTSQFYSLSFCLKRQQIQQIVNHSKTYIRMLSQIDRERQKLPKTIQKNQRETQKGSQEGNIIQLNDKKNSSAEGEQKVDSELLMDEEE